LVVAPLGLPSCICNGVLIVALARVRPSKTAAVRTANDRNLRNADLGEDVIVQSGLQTWFGLDRPLAELPN